jgi:spore germination protein KB
MLLAVGSAMIFPYTFLPIVNSPPGNQDVWIAMLLAFVYIVVLSAPFLYLINKCRGLSLAGMMDIILGNVAGKILLVPIIFFFVYCVCACMMIVAQFIILYLLPNTPLWAIYLYMLVPVCYTVGKGAGTIARMATFIVPFIIVTIVLFLVFGLEQMNFRILFPILSDSTLWELNAGAFLTAARYSEILILVVFSRHLSRKSSINKTYAAALVAFGLCFLGILLPTILTLGVDLAKIVNNPYFVFTRQVEALGFLERIHAINTLAWFPASLLKLSVYLYMASETLSELFSSKSHRTFVLPIAVFALIFGLIPFINSASTITLLSSDKIFPFVIIPVIFLIPLFTVIVFCIRRRKIGPVLAKAKDLVSADEQTMRTQQRLS